MGKRELTEVALPLDFSVHLVGAETPYIALKCLPVRSAHKLLGRRADGIPR